MGNTQPADEATIFVLDGGSIVGEEELISRVPDQSAVKEVVPCLVEFRTRFSHELFGVRVTG